MDDKKKSSKSDANKRALAIAAEIKAAREAAEAK